MRKLPAPPKPRTLPKTPMRKPTPPKQRSSSVEHHEFLPDENSPETGQLTVTYRGGRKYLYAGVGAHHVSAMKNAPSLGTYLHQHIVGKHPVTKLGS